ncbi:two-component regulator propeller domain-containing protein [Winogradskyella sp.]|uniref:sensor histidine kinase n=1 Tax=Winogradskyella sp. TaxID=1883156 RepID=UPI003BA9D8A4
MRFTFLIFFSFFIISSHAQQYDFKTLDTSNGLPSNEVHSILAASDGRIWLGTMGGVSVFNGSTFTNYTRKEGLASNYVLTLFEDSKGRIWIGTVDKGVSRIENGKIKNFERDNPQEVFGTVAFLEGDDGTVYAIAHHTITAYKNDEASLMHSEFFKFPKSLAPNDVAWLDKETILIASTSYGLIKFNIKTTEITYMDSESHNINNICYTVFLDVENVIWLGAYGAMYKIIGDDVITYNFNKKEANLNRVVSIKPYGTDTLVLGLEGNGFAIFNKSTGDYKLYNESVGFQSEYVSDVALDREENIWLGTLNSGIGRFRDESFKFYDASDGLPSDKVNDVEIFDGHIRIATDKGVATLVNNKIQKQLLTSAPTTSLTKTFDNQLLYTTDSEVVLTNAKNDRRILDKGVYHFGYNDSTNTILMATRSMKIINRDSSYIINAFRSIDIAPIGDNYLLPKTQGLFNFENGTLSEISGLPIQRHSFFTGAEAISKNEVVAINDDSLYHITLNEGNYNIATYNYKKENEAEGFNSFSTKNNALYFAKKGRYYKIDLSRLLINNTIVESTYKFPSKFRDSELIFNGTKFLEDGTLVGIPSNGVLFFDETKYKPNYKAPLLNLRTVKLFAEPLADSIYREKEKLVLPYDSNHLSFTMEAISFTNSEEIKYKYRLKGLREGDVWSQPTSNPNVVYSYIPAGHYVFEFTADNGNGIWQKEPVKLALTIKIPFWRLWYFWITVLVLTSFLIIGYIIYRNKKKQKLKEEFTQDLLNAQEQERIRISGELHDSIGQSLLMVKNKILFNSDYKTVDMVDEIIDEVREMSRNLHPFKLQEMGLTDTINSNIDSIDEHQDIFITTEIDDIDGLFKPEQEINIFRLIQESFNNILKHSNAKSAQIQINNFKDHISIVITDNGKGFNVEKEQQSKSKIGLKTLQERVSILNGTFKVVSSKRGTILYFNIPKNA